MLSSLLFYPNHFIRFTSLRLRNSPISSYPLIVLPCINVTRRGTYLFELHPTILSHHHHHHHSISPFLATSCQYLFHCRREPTRLPFPTFLFPTSPSSTNKAHSVFGDSRQLLLIQHSPGGYSRDPREFKRKRG